MVPSLRQAHCLINVKSFSAYVDGEYVATIVAESVKTSLGYQYVFDASLVLGGVDLSRIEIKSNEQDFVFESDLYHVG